MQLTFKFNTVSVLEPSLTAPNTRCCQCLLSPANQSLDLTQMEVGCATDYTSCGRQGTARACVCACVCVLVCVTSDTNMRMTLYAIQHLSKHHQ